MTLAWLAFAALIQQPAPHPSGAAGAADPTLTVRGQVTTGHGDPLEGVPIAMADIVWIKAEGDYARVHTAGKSYLVSRSLKELDVRLDSSLFLRLHRSTIVQTSHIAEVRPAGSARYHLRLDDGTTVIVSRSRAKELKDRIL